MLAEYLSFIVLLFALYVVAGGILVTGNLRGTPLVNTAILAFGTLIASVVGTTGAAMILIRPLHARQRAPAAQRPCRRVFHHPGRQHRRRAVAARRSAAVRRLPARRRFLLAGAATCWQQTALVAGIVLAIFLLLDLWFYRKDRAVTTVGEPPAPIEPARARRDQSSCCSPASSAAILMSPLWQPGIALRRLRHLLELQNCCATACSSASRSCRSC